MSAHMKLHVELTPRLCAMNRECDDGENAAIARILRDLATAIETGGIAHAVGFGAEVNHAGITGQAWTTGSAS